MKGQAVTVITGNFSIGQICGSGQCFRMTPKDGGKYQVIACGRRLELKQEGERVTFYCGRQEYEAVWKNYFDLEADYAGYIARIEPRDKYLLAAAGYGSGIRILNQDLWEMIVSFIISQQNNIVRIRKCIETVCERYGTLKDGFYDFPTPQELSAATEEELRVCGLGYRSRYLAGTACMVAGGEVSLGRIRQMGYRSAREELQRLPGVGIKVADCICLFALHHLDAFPVDTHIRSVLEAHYPKGFPVRRYKGCRGVMQQYIFYYDLKKAELL